MIRVLPDLLSSSMFSRVTSQLRHDLDRAAMEAVTGERADVTAASNGQLGQVHRVRYAIETEDATATRLALVTGRYATAASALKGARESAGTLPLDALNAAVAGGASNLGSFADAAKEAMRGVFAALNTRFDERALFAGAASDAQALAPLDEVMQTLSMALAGAPTAADKAAVIEAYFGPGGGFEADAYGGAAEDANGVELPDGAEVDPLPRADDAAFRNLMKGLATVAFSDTVEPGEAAGFTERGAGLVRAGTDGVTRMEARVGLGLNRTAAAGERAKDGARVAAEALDRVAGRDAFEAASETQSLETRLQAAYSLTSKLGRLSLTSFLR